MSENPVPREEGPVRAALQAVLARARARVPYADALYERVFKAEVNLLDNGQVLLKPGSLQGALQLRLVDAQGRHLSVKAGALNPEDLAALVDRALEMLALEPPDPSYGLAPIPNPSRQRYGVMASPDPRDTDPTVALGHLVSEVRRVARRACGPHPLGYTTVQPELWAWWQVEDKWVADTDGVVKSQTMPVVFLQATFQARRGQRSARVRERLGGPGGAGVLVDPEGALTPNAEAALSEAAARAVGLLAARSLTAEELGRLTHFVLHKSALVFIHEGLGHPIEADIARAGASAIVRADGTPAVDPLGSELVRIVDGPGSNPLEGGWGEGFGTEHLDDEGVEVGPTVLVDRGRIVGMMHSRETAHAFGARPTGNGFSELGDRRIVRMRNTVLVPRPDARWVSSLDALVQDVPFGVVLHGSMGGAVAREGMSSSTQYGLLVRDGKVTEELILPGNFSARTADCLRTVDGFAGAVDAHGLGFCGKNGQSRRVSEGGPEYVRLGASAAVRLTFEEA
jgi:predicted Zn-dependent protease